MILQGIRYHQGSPGTSTGPCLLRAYYRRASWVTARTVPTPTEYLYTYQATITGTAPLSSLAVELILGSWVDNIGQFTATGISGDPSIFSFLVTNASANWAFDGVGGTSNAVTTTLGLAFSSPDVPTSSSGTTIDDGTFGPLALLPAPVLHVPEPASLALATTGVAMAALAWVGRNRSALTRREALACESKLEGS